MDYKDIAAYSNSDYEKNIEALINNPGFLDLLNKFSTLPEILGENNIDAVINRFKQVKSVDDFQLIMHDVIEYNVKTTTDGLTYSGIENLPENKGSLFVSNHRSTSLDAAYINEILFRAGRETVYNGAGDNIFETKWLGYMIRLNKGFIIKRDVEDIDEKITEATRLSGYINSLLIQGRSVWIAQRPGRAKDGIDATDSVIIAMLFKSLEDKSYGEWLSSINLNPVAISWEIVPCDLTLARELAGETDAGGQFRDLKNILFEIGENKGRVHFSFCKSVHGERRGEIVKAIDAEIQQSYKLWGSNWLAWLETEEVSDADRETILKNIDVPRAEKILGRAKDLSPEAGRKLYEMYANPVKSSLRYTPSITDHF